MSISSMTGFGRGEKITSSYIVVFELTTLNSKQFDCSLTLPKDLLRIDSLLQAVIKKSITRGFIKGNLNIISKANTTFSTIDTESVKRQVLELRKLAEALELKDDLTASTLISLLAKNEKPEKSSTQIKELEEAAFSALEIALTELLRMRKREGEALKTDLLKRLLSLRTVYDDIHILAPRVPLAHKATLEKRLNDLLPSGMAVDASMLAREIAIFADKCDISEELTRLSSHFQQMQSILEEDESCGRKLDFLCQEMFREINTTGSKANDVEISRNVITFKAILETLREQIKNIE